MTQPTVFFFGPDGGTGEAPGHLKVFLRTLLYSTSKKGQTIESLHVSLQRGESKQNFSTWVYGDEKLTRGSGLYVGPEGVATNHHFLLPRDGTDFPLLSGKYIVRVYAKRVTDRAAMEIATVDLSISESQAKELQGGNAGVYFDWGPEQQAYHSHIDTGPPRSIPPSLVKAAMKAFLEEEPPS